MFVWSLINQKGGTGKTTTAIHASAALAARGKRVLLVDLDPQAHATLGLGCDVDGRPSIAEVFAGRASISDAALAVSNGIHLVPAHLGLAEFEERAERMLGPERILGSALAEVESRYDHVLIDCSPRADGALAANALRTCDTALLVVETSVFALQGALRAFDILEECAGTRLGKPLDVRLVATMYDRRTRLAREILTAMQARFGMRLFDSVIRRSVRLREAVAYGVPLQQLDPGAPAVADFEALAQEMTAIAEARPARPASATATDAEPLFPRGIDVPRPQSKEEFPTWNP